MLECKISYLPGACLPECNMYADQAGRDDVGKTFGEEE
jgi:hypothetical protein